MCLGVLALLGSTRAVSAPYVRSAYPSSGLVSAPQALARFTVAGWGTKLVSVSGTNSHGETVVTRRTTKGWVWPRGTLRPGETLHISLVAKRPDWAAPPSSGRKNTENSQSSRRARA